MSSINGFSKYDFLASIYHDSVEKTRIVLPLLEKIPLHNLLEKAQLGV